MQFLVIDDDGLSRELLTMLLGTAGHEAELAASGDEALARLSAVGKSCPEVILSDMQMPGLSGVGLAQALRETVGDKSKLLAMSGSRPAETVLQAFDGFLLKPFSMEDLHALLARTLPGSDISEAAPGDTVLDCGTHPEVTELNEEIYVRMGTMMSGAQLGELYGMCLADTRNQVIQMGTLAEAGDDAGYRKAAHMVKGGCGMIGATELYALAEIAERNGLTRLFGPAFQTSTVKELLGHFSGACDRLERILGQRC